MIGREMLWKKIPSACAVDHSVKTAPDKGLGWVSVWHWQAGSDGSIPAAWLFTCQAQEMQRLAIKDQPRVGRSVWSCVVRRTSSA